MERLGKDRQDAIEKMKSALKSLQVFLLVFIVTM